MKKLSLLLAIVMLLSTLTISVGSVSATDTEIREPDIYITSQDYGNSATTLEYQTTTNKEKKIYNRATQSTVAVRGIGVTPTANGFEIDADAASFAPGASLTGTFVTGATNAFKDKAYRADSVKFKMPEFNDDGFAYLFAYSNKDYYNANVFASVNTDASRNGAYLKIKNGGVYTGDINLGETVTGVAGNRAYNKTIVANNTLVAGTWYRAERIIDCRVDGENYQRFIIYNDSTNEILGDSGWVWTGKISKNGAAYPNYAFGNLGFGAWLFDNGSKMVIDEIKSYALNDVSEDYFVGNDSDCEDSVYVRYPGPTYQGFTGYLAEIHAVVYQFHSAYRNPSIPGMPSAKSPMMYAEQSFMLPSINTAEIRLFDIPKAGSNCDATNRTPGNGTVYLKDGQLKVYGWNATDSNYSTEVSFTDNTTSYAVEAGKWYKLRWTVDSTNLTDDNADTFAADAKIELMDENGTVLKETRAYSIKPYSIYNWVGGGNLIYSFKFLQSDYSHKFKAGLDIALDNFKLVTSDGAIDSENAVTYIDEDFQNYSAGTMLNTIIHKEGVSLSDATKATAVEVSKYVWDGTVKNVDPQNARITFTEAMNKAVLENPEYVKIYAGDSNTDDPTLINSLAYDETTKTLTIGLNTVAHSTTYTIKVDRNAATASGDIFSRMQGVYTFQTKEANSDTFSIDEVYCLNADGTDYATTPIIAGQTINVKVALTTNSAVNIPYAAMAAIYDADGNLEDVQAASGFGSKADCESGAMIVPIPAITAETNGGYVKVFVWDSFASMTPYDQSTIYPAVTK